jgi:hypothetical protein
MSLAEERHAEHRSIFRRTDRGAHKSLGTDK